MKLKELWRSARYAVFAWLDRRTGWRWANNAAWDAVFAKHGDALAAEANRLRAGVPLLDLKAKFPASRAAHAIENAKVGAWFTYCCHADLERIETQEQAEQIRREHAEYDGSSNGMSGWPWRVWPTRREALEDLLKSSDGEEAEEIKAMLRTEEP